MIAFSKKYLSLFKETVNGNDLPESFFEEITKINLYRVRLLSLSLLCFKLLLALTFFIFSLTIGKSLNTFDIHISHIVAATFFLVVFFVSGQIKNSFLFIRNHSWTFIIGASAFIIALLLTFSQNSIELSVSIFMLSLCGILCGFYWRRLESLIFLSAGLISLLIISIFFIPPTLNYYLNLSFYIVFCFLFYILSRHFFDVKAREHLVLLNEQEQKKLLRKKNEELEVYQQKLKEAEELAGVGFFELDTQNNSLYFSEGLQKLLEINPIGKMNVFRSPFDFIDTPEKERVELEMFECIKTHKEYKTEFKSFTLAGNIKYLSFYAKQSAENSTKILGTLKDITEPKVLDIARSESESITQALLENQKLSIWAVNKEFKVIIFNDYFAKFVKDTLGKTLSKGMDIREIFPENQFSFYFNLYKKVFDGENYVKELILFPETEKEQWYELHLNGIKNNESKIIGVSIIAINITGRKKNEKSLINLALVANKTANVVLMCDNELKIEWVNQSFIALSDFSFQESFGHSLHELLSPQGINDKIFSTLRDCKGNKTNFSGEILCYKKNGNAYWLNININPVFDDKNELVKFIAIGNDITDKKEVELKLNSARELADKLIKAKEQYLSMITHDLRTPLGGVLGLTELLLNDKLLSGQVNMLNSLKYSAEHMMGLINDVLDVSKVEEGKIKFDKNEFKIRELLEKTIATFTGVICEKNIIINSKIEENIPISLVGDAKRLRQILINLIGNAIKFTENGSVTVLVREKIIKGNKIELVFDIIDTGVGMEPENAIRIFNKFEQLETGIHTKQKGSGLGLYITKQLIELQGGDIDVKSYPGQGTTFTFYLPFLLYDNEKGTKYPSKSEKIRLLLAEDNKINQLITSQYLNKWKIDFDVVENGLDAVTMSNKNHYDLILLDIQMPMMDGFEACQIIKKHNPDIPIIALTATSLECTKQINESGINDFILKPFDPEQLHNKILKYCK